MSNECFNDGHDAGGGEDSDLEYEENQLVRIEKQGAQMHILPD